MGLWVCIVIPCLTSALFASFCLVPFLGKYLRIRREVKEAGAALEIVDVVIEEASG